MFGDQVVGAEAVPVTITLSNEAALPFRVSEASLSAGTDFMVQKTCSVIAAHASGSCIRVRFQPTTEGSKSDALTIKSTAPGPPLVIELSGRGIAPAPSR